MKFKYRKNLLLWGIVRLDWCVRQYVGADGYETYCTRLLFQQLSRLSQYSVSKSQS